jgi:LuxR family maltose regulon positive regulatory protein
VVKLAIATAEDRALHGPDLPASIDVARAWISTEECDLPAALAYADRAAVAATPTTARSDPFLAAALALVRARLLRMRGDYSAAGGTLRAARMGTPAMPAPVWLSQTLVAAETSLAITAGRRDDAAPGTGAHPDPPSNAAVLAWATLERHDNARSIEHATEDLQNKGLPLDRRIDAWLLTAAGRLAQGRPQLARTAVEQGLRLAESEQLRRPILEAPPAVRRFMRHNAQLADRYQWILANTPAAATGQRLTPPILVQPLTEREREVLRLLAAMVSTEEIATNMFISMNTVRTHIRGILRKLSATRRHEAVRRAREFGLI